MTVMDLINQLGQFNYLLLACLILLPILTFLYWRFISDFEGNEDPHRYVYATIVYLACIPGIFASVLTAYTLFFINGNLLEVNLIIYFLPILSMFATLAMVSKAANLERLPGFGRLRGLMTLLALTFLIAFFMIRFRIWLAFGGSFLVLALMMVALFLGLRWSAARIFRR